MDTCNVREVLPTVCALALKLWNPACLETGLDIEDLIQEGWVAAIERRVFYDAAREASFLTYCYPRIRGAMLDAMRRSAKETAKRRAAIRESLVHMDWLYAPSTSDLFEGRRWACRLRRALLRLAPDELGLVQHVLLRTSGRVAADELGMSHWQFVRRKDDVLAGLRDALTGSGRYGPTAWEPSDHREVIHG